MQKLSKFYPVGIAIASLLPLVAGAQKDIDAIISDILATAQTIIGLLFIIATIVFLWGVIMFIAKADNPAERDKAKGIMTWGIIGLAVMAAAWGVTSILINYFGATQTPSFVKPPTV